MGKAWGNALGGYRTQKRIGGRFASGRSVKGKISRANAIGAKKNAYAKKKYKKRGGAYQQHLDRKNSVGIYSTNIQGKKLSARSKKANKIAANVMMTNPGYASVVLASKYRGKKKKKR